MGGRILHSCHLRLVLFYTFNHATLPQLPAIPQLLFFCYHYQLGFYTVLPAPPFLNTCSYRDGALDYHGFHIGFLLLHCAVTPVTCLPDTVFTVRMGGNLPFCCHHRRWCFILCRDGNGVTTRDGVAYRNGARILDASGTEYRSCLRSCRTAACVSAAFWLLRSLSAPPVDRPATTTVQVCPRTHARPQCYFGVFIIPHSDSFSIYLPLPAVYLD